MPLRSARGGWFSNVAISMKQCKPRLWRPGWPDFNAYGTAVRRVLQHDRQADILYIKLLNQKL